MLHYFILLEQVLRTLSDKYHNYSERSSRSWWTWHGPRWNLSNHVTKNGNRGHMIGNSVRAWSSVRGYGRRTQLARRTDVLSHYYGQELCI